MNRLYSRNSNYTPVQTPRPASTVYRPATAAPQDQLWSWFTSVDADHSGSITVRELQRALVNGNWTSKHIHVLSTNILAWMLMNIFDVDRSGTISFNEFSGLWKYISDWQNVFKNFDRDGSGTIDGQELATALRSFGYNLSPFILSLIEQKYASLPDDNGHTTAAGITFDRFVRACVSVKMLTESFQREDTDRDGWVQVNYETFMRITLSAP
ncbi:hypothetical protein BU17DRAFT_92271 [Hysterangium stoloniferum]|nr:hypothetical protein BU17DRAFT_92271 [Hysterangium stoloniferum]